DPTPVIGTLGLVETLRHRPPGIGWTEGVTVLLLGRSSSTDESDPHPLGGSRWAVERRGRRGGTLAPLDLAAHRRLLDLVTGLVASGVAGGDGPICGVHDVSGGGLAVALAEMAVRGGVGLVTDAVSGPAELFCEVPSRVLVATHRPAEVTAGAEAAGVPAIQLGVAGGDRLAIAGLVDLSIPQITAAWEGALPVAVGDGLEEVP
ncbi:MAG TPA: AIR synthase-related protein, partial [Acidimicrobiales bacterium]|nr:AIR synthase-related protein [Acidimicrobiales bacterium]